MSVKNQKRCRVCISAAALCLGVSLMLTGCTMSGMNRRGEQQDMRQDHRQEAMEDNVDRRTDRHVDRAERRTAP